MNWEGKGKGDCFEVAANIVGLFNMALITGDAEQAAIKLLTVMDVKQTDIRLVHGWVARPGDGLMHPHAWVEIPEMQLVLDHSNGHKALMHRERYRQLGKVKGTLEYDYEQARKMMVDYATYGPWDETFNEKGE